MWIKLENNQLPVCQTLIHECEGDLIYLVVENIRQVPPCKLKKKQKTQYNAQIFKIYKHQNNCLQYNISYIYVAQ